MVRQCSCPAGNDSGKGRRVLEVKIWKVWDIAKIDGSPSAGCPGVMADGRGRRQSDERARALARIDRPGLAGLPCCIRHRYATPYKNGALPYAPATMPVPAGEDY
jgi:hypothetical protein